MRSSWSSDQRPAIEASRLSGQMICRAFGSNISRSDCGATSRLGDIWQFLRYAFASNGEVKSADYAAEGRNYLSASETADLISLNESIAKMLRRWQATLEKDQGWTKDKGRTKDQGRTRNQGPSSKDRAAYPIFDIDT